MTISGYPRGHNVKWVTRCQRHTGPDLIDGYSPRTEHLPNPADHHQRETPREWEDLCSAMLKLLADVTVVGRSSLLSSTGLT